MTAPDVAPQQRRGMTPDHCPACPFKACPGCRYKGGESVVAQENTGLIRYDGNVSNETAPAGNRGLTTSPAKES